jgi:simple sugar transport system permease protein
VSGRLRPAVRSLALHLIPVYAVVLALLCAIPLLAAASIDPFEAIRVMIDSAVGSPIAIGNSITDATPLLFTALAVAICFRAGVYNIGGEGQLYVGALAGSAVAIYVHGLPSWLLITCAFLASAAAGALWGLLPALAKVYRGTNEILSTLLLNFVAIYIVAYFVARRYGPMHGEGVTFAGSEFIQPAAHLPSILPDAQASSAFVLALALALATAFAISRTTTGFQLRAAGLNPVAARYAGHADKSLVIGTMVVSGAIAGLAGTASVLFETFLLAGALSPPPGWGYVGITVALLGGLRPLPIVLAALFFGALQAGAEGMQLATNTPASIAGIIQAIVIVLVLAGGVARVALLRRATVAATRRAGGDRGEAIDATATLADAVASQTGASRGVSAP